MSEKVKVSREVAEALESAKEIRSDETITDMCISKSFVSVQEPLNNLNPYTLVKILISGYEIEQTPEEKIAEIYKHHLGKPSLQPIWNEGVMDGIKMTLRTFDIKVPGINE